MKLKTELQKLLKTRTNLKKIAERSGVPISTIWHYAHKENRDITVSNYNKLNSAMAEFRGLR